MLPFEFENRMTEMLGEDFPLFSAEMEKEPVRALKINTLFTDESVCDGFDFFHEKIDYLEGAYIFEKEGIGNLPLHHAGAFYVQDPSAMSTVFAACEYVRPGMRVLDMCAAPGGKTVQLASLLHGEGVLVSNEISRERVKILRSNIERMGVRGSVITSCDTRIFAESYPEWFDVILCDVPCSGEGMLRKYNEEVLANWSLENVLTCAERQRYILENAYRALAPGGVIIYSTCTFSREENEDNIEYILSSHSDLSTLPLNERILSVTAEGIGLSDARRFYPHISRGEGQFICILKKAGEGEKRSAREKKSPIKPLSKEEDKIARDFLSQIDGGDNFNLGNMNGNVVILPEDAICPESTLICGTIAGEVIKGRFEPHHQLFKAYGKDFKNKVSLSSSSAEALLYIRGEAFRCEGENGWCAVLIDSCPAGGGKLVNGLLKNHYPKGLRIRSNT